MARITLSTHWKFQRLARALGSKVLARGILETLWEPSWVVGDPYVGTSQDIEALCEWKGEKGGLTKALLMPGAKNAGFIEPYEGSVRDHGDVHYQIHDFFQHCPEYVKRRHDRENRLMTDPKTCEGCRQDYFAHNPTSRYCSNKCRQSAFVSAHAHDVPNSAAVLGAVRTGVRKAPNSGAVLGAVRRAVRKNATAVHEKGDKSDQSSSHDSGLNSAISANSLPSLTADLTAANSAPLLGANFLEYVRTYSPVLESTYSPGCTYLEPQVGDDVAHPPPATPSTPKRTAHPPPLPVLEFPTVGTQGKSWSLTADRVAEWQAAFPGIDVMAEIRMALAWTNANPTKRKTVKGMPKFLVAWLTRKTDSGSGPSTKAGRHEKWHSGGKADVADV